MQVEELVAPDKKLRFTNGWLARWWWQNPLVVSIAKENGSGDWVQHEDIGIDFDDSGNLPATNHQMTVCLLFIEFELSFRFRFRRWSELWVNHHES